MKYNTSPMPLSIENYYSFFSGLKKELDLAAKENKFGIENLKKVEVFKANLIQEVWDICEQWNRGVKPTGWIIFRFFDNVFDFGKIMQKREEIEKEYADLTTEENLELNKCFIDSLRVDDIDFEEFMERTNFMISVNANYINYLASLKK